MTKATDERRRVIANNFDACASGLAACLGSDGDPQELVAAWRKYAKKLRDGIGRDGGRVECQR